MRRLLRDCLFLVLAAAATAGLGPLLSGALRASQDDWHLDIERAMDVVGVRPGMVVGEAGAGDGYFTLPMARRVGPAGAILANDINRRHLERLADRARRGRVSNIQIVVGSVDDPLFPRHDLARIVIVHSLHDFDHPVEWLVNARKYLRPDGLLAVIDLDPRQGAPNHFLTREKIRDYAASAGYTQVKLVDEVSNHLIVLLQPRIAGPAPAARRGAKAAGQP